MKRPLAFLGLALLALAPAHAGDYQLKNRSRFELGETAHNPFWPIGWVKPERGAQADAPAITLRPEDFAVSSISIAGSERFAVINGRVYGVGEVLRVSVNGQKVPVQLSAIHDGAVVVSCQGQMVTVTLKRKEDQALRPVTTTALNSARED